ncbi:MAG: transporter substrate-binding domain-containing protein, partial [Campylobacterales bacterium]|nr:transporter substrate-binding domain-containing protein [Campylobacterales bacterium]
VMSLRNFQPFNFMRNDKPTGYSVDTIKVFGDYLGVKIQFVDKPWKEQLEMFKKQELDIIPHLAVNEEREGFSDYTNFIHLNFLIGFAINKEDTISSMKDLKGKKIAVVDQVYLHNHIKSAFPDIEIYATTTTREAVEAVAQGKAFAVIDNLPTLNYFIQEKWLTNLKIATVSDLGIPLNTEMPMGVPKGNTLLKSILEKTHTFISEKELPQLKKKWLFNTDYSTQLTQDEKKYLKENPTIRFRINPSRPPFEFYENNQAKGIAVDYVRFISKKLNFKVEFIPDDSTIQEAFNEMEKEDKLYDSLLFSVKSKDREKRFVFGDTYLTYPVMIVTNKLSSYISSAQDLKGKTIVLEKGFLTNKWIKKDYPEINIVNVNDTIQALQLVNDGKADGYIGNVAVANYLMNHRSFDNLRISAPTKYGYVKFSFMSPKATPEIATILSKGFRQITPIEHSSIHQKWFSLQTIEKIDYFVIWQILIGALTIILLILWWTNKLRFEKKRSEDALQALKLAQEELKRKNQELEEISVTDRLTKIYNRGKLDDSLETELQKAQRYKHTFGVIILDIDYFKEVNDNYGHIVGDKLLIEITQVFQTHIRKTDILGRWGGEEFLIICPHSDLEGTKEAAEHLRKEIEKKYFTDVGVKTASFGVTALKEGDSVTSLIKRADDALYTAKNNGRNRVEFK